MSSLRVIYACQSLPLPGGPQSRSIFLAGPTPRASDVPSWRPSAIQTLRNLGFDGLVFVPEAEGGGWHGIYEQQVEWEWSALGLANKVVFWVPRELNSMPAFTTNVEFGFMVARYPERVILGCPDGAPKVRYLKMLASQHAVFAEAMGSTPREIPVVNTLESALELATL